MAMRASTRSPTFTFSAGFAGAPFTVTLPARQSSVAAERVGVRRTAQSHASMRADSMRPSCHGDGQLSLNNARALSPMNARRWSSGNMATSSFRSPTYSGVWSA